MHKIHNFEEPHVIPSDDLGLTPEDLRPLEDTYQAVVSGLIHRFNAKPDQLRVRSHESVQIGPSDLPKIKDLTGTNIAADAVSFPLRISGVEIGSVTMHPHMTHPMPGTIVKTPGQSLNNGTETVDVLFFRKDPDMVTMETRIADDEAQSYYRGITALGIVYASRLPIGNLQQLERVKSILDMAD